MQKQRVLLSWSSGKDSAWSLHVLRQQDDLEVVGLLTTFNEAADRVAMHAVRRSLVEDQAAAAGLPLISAGIPSPCPNDVYEQAMENALHKARNELDITAVAFGDLFLEDIRTYREEKMATTGLQLVFPLWGRDTTELAQEMVDGGLRAIITCVDPKVLPASFAGRTFDASLLRDLPEEIDPCGERGEFHTLTFAGPMFGAPIACTPGEIVTRDGFVFADVVRPPT